jgi:hypothetical protein
MHLPRDLPVPCLFAFEHLCEHLPILGLPAFPPRDLPYTFFDFFDFFDFLDFLRFPPIDIAIIYNEIKKIYLF